MSDELSGADRGSTPPSFDFDDDAITSLLDNFVETQTGPQAKRVSRPPNPDDSGAQAAQRTVFQHASRHEALPLVGRDDEAKQRRVTLLEVLAEKTVGSTRARLLTSAGELYEQLGDLGAATDTYRRALAADARDVVVLRALRRLAIRGENWQAAAEALEQEAALDLTFEERAAALALLAQIQLSKLGDPAAAEQAASHAAELDDEAFIPWILAASARLTRGQHARAGEALSNAAERWPVAEARAVILMHAAELMEHGGQADEAKTLFAQVLEIQPNSFAARLGMVRAARELKETETALSALRAAAEHAPSHVGEALLRTATVVAKADDEERDLTGSLQDARHTASIWTLAEAAALRGDLNRAAEAFATDTHDATPTIASIGEARRARLLTELGGLERTPAGRTVELDAYLAALAGLTGRSGAAVQDAFVSTSVARIDSPAATMVRANEAARVGDRQSFVAALEAERDTAGEPFAESAALGLAEAMGAQDGLGSGVRWLQEHEAALEWRTDYLPTLWSLEERANEPDERAHAAVMLADVDPAGAKAHRLRASLWSTDDDEKARLAESALEHDAPDPLLIEHLLMTAGANTEKAGDLLVLAAEKLQSAEYLRRAAESYRTAGLPRREARSLRDACGNAPQDPALRARRKDAELRAGEFARLADDAMRRVREASNDDDELRAFSAMAEVDRLARCDMQSARLSLQSIAEARPDHVPTARALEWDALHERDPDRIRTSARRLLQALAQGSSERLARHRLIVELLRADSDILQNDVDRALLALDEPLDADPGLARQVLGAAYAKNETELGLHALIALQASLGDDLERAALALEASHLLQRGGDTGRALEALNTAGNHPLALEAEAHLLRAAKRWEDAAAVYRDAASRAKDHQRAASLWREAACILEDELGRSEEGLEAWEAAVNADVTYLDVYRRLAAAYQREGLADELGLLIDARIEAGADTPTLVGLLLDKAAHRRECDDLAGVIDALSECLELDPSHFGALQQLVEVQRGEEDWQGAAEALIRIARLKRSVEEQVWAFSQLAEVYHEHLEDLPRAEASLRRALELAPAYTETLDRLASVLTQQNKARDAVRLLQELVRRAGNESEARDYRIRLAETVERAGDPRQAEALFEQLRSEQPTEPDVILAVADHYARLGAGPAESMHLNRAVNDLRDAIRGRPGDEALWTTLVRVLNRRHGPGAASCAASAAIAIGHPASLFEGDVTTRDGALGEPKIPLSPVVDAIVAPPTLPQTAARLFALCEHSFDKMLPFDASAWRLRRPSGEHRTLVEEAGAVAEALGISEPRLKVTYIAPVACMPISGDPPTLVVGGSLHELTTPEERVFLFARALKVAANHLASALRARPEELDVALLALLHGHDPSRPQGAEPEQMRELRKKLVKAVPRRWRDEVESLVLELAGNPAFSTRLVPFAVSSLGDRAALTLTGDVPSAANALLKIAGHDAPAGQPGRLDAITETPEAWALIQFAISDAHFEARAQAGVDP